jgi:hypothetical protein
MPPSTWLEWWRDCRFLQISVWTSCHRILSTTNIKMAVFRICVGELIPELFDKRADSALKELTQRIFYTNRWVNRSFIFHWHLALLKQRRKRLIETTAYYVNNNDWLRESLQLPFHSRTNANRRLNIMIPWSFTRIWNSSHRFRDIFVMRFFFVSMCTKLRLVDTKKS